MPRAIKAISFPDILIFLGLAMLGTGLWWLAPWISLSAVGSIVAILGFLGSIGGKA